MNKISHDTTKLETLARLIVPEEKRLESLRRLFAEDSMEKLTRFLVSGSKSEGGSTCKR